LQLGVRPKSSSTKTENGLLACAISSRAKIIFYLNGNGDIV